jgi:hypothetical protein
MESTRGKFRATAEKENIEEASRRGLQDHRCGNGNFEKPAAVTSRSLMSQDKNVKLR